MVLELILDMTKGFREYLLIPFSLTLLAFCIYLFYKNRKDIIKPFEKIRRKYWIGLLFIVIVSISIRLYFPIGHRMYFDEFDYMANAKKIINLDWRFYEMYQKEPILAPILYSFSFLTFGISNQTAIYTSLAFGVFTVILFFLFTYYVTKNEKIALTSAFFLSILAEHVVWCTSAERNVISLFFLLLSLMLALMFSDKKKSSLLVLTICSMVLASIARTENHVVFLLLIPLFIIYRLKPKRYLTKRNVLIILVLAFLMLPNFINQLELFFTNNWSQKESLGEFEDNFSIGNLIHNSKIDLKAIFFPAHMNILVNLFLLGLLALGTFLFAKCKRNEFIFLIIFLIIFYLAYFLAWPTVQARTRFYLTFYLIFVLFVAFGIFSLNKIGLLITSKISISIVILISILYLPYVNAVYEAQEQNYFKFQTLSVIDVIRFTPKECTIVAYNHNFITSTSDLNVITYREFVELNGRRDIDFAKSCYVLYCGVYCKEKLTMESNALIIHEDYNLIHLKDYEWYASVYKIQSKKPLKSPVG